MYPSLKRRILFLIGLKPKFLEIMEENALSSKNPQYL